MAYGLKYQISISSFQENPLIFQIYERDYTGSSSSYIGYGRSHAVLNYEEVDFWQPVKPSSLNLTLLAQTDGQYEEFKDAKDRDYYIKILTETTTQSKRTGYYTINSISSITRTYPTANYTDALKYIQGYYPQFKSLPDVYRETGVGGRGIDFNSDGTKMYTVTAAAVSDGVKIYEYNLSTAWDPSTKTLNNSYDSGVSGESSLGLFIKPDGTKLYVPVDSNGSHYIYEYNLSTAWNLSTISKNSQRDMGSVIVNDLVINPDGTKLFAVYYSPMIESFTLSTPWDITSASWDGENERLWVAQDLSTRYGYGISISPEGDYLQVSVVSGDIRRIYPYTLLTNWTLSTASYDWDIESMDAYWESLQLGMAWGDNGRLLFIIEDDFVYWREITDRVFFNRRWRLVINGLNKAEIEIIKDLSDTHYGSREALINDLIQEVVDSHSIYEGSDTTGDNYNDTITHVDDYTFSGSTKIEKISLNNELLDTYGSTSFSGGNEGHILYLKADVDGVEQTLYTVEALDSLTIEDIVNEAVEEINNNEADFEASTNEDDSDRIDITYTGSGTSVTLTSSASYTGWDVTSNGISSEEIEINQVIWEGFNIGGLYQREYIRKHYPVGIEATDGLADLKNVKYEYTTGTKSLIRLIAEILQETGLKLNINSAVDLYESTFDSTSSDDPLAQTYIDIESVVKKGYLVILNEKLKGFKLIQDRGEWWIVRPDSKDSFAYRKFDYTGAYLSNHTYNPLIEVGSTNLNIRRSGFLASESGHKAYIIKQNYGLKDQLIKDPTMALVNTSNELRFWSSNDHSIYSYNDDDYIVLQKGGTGYIEQIVANSKGTSYEFTFNGKFESFTKSDLTFDTEKDQMSVVSISPYPYLDISNIDADYLKEGVLVALEATSTGSIISYTYIRYIEDGKAYINDTNVGDDTVIIYLANVYIEATLQLGNSYWYNDQLISAQAGVTKFKLFEDYANNNWDRKTIKKSFEFTSSQVYDIKIKIYQPYNINTIINKVTLKPTGDYKKGKRVKKYYPEALENFKNKEKDITFKAGDLPTAYNDGSDLFLNIFYTDSSRTLTSGWPADDYVDEISDRIVYQSGKNGYRLKGEFLIHEKINSVLDVIYDLIHTKYFSLVGGEYDLRLGTINGSWIEIEKGSPGTLTKESKLYEDQPSGTDLYKDNRSSFEEDELGGGTTIVQQTAVDKDTIIGYDYTFEDLSLIEQFRGFRKTFVGNDTTNRQITIYHNRGYEEVSVDLFQDNKKVKDDNFDYDTQGSTNYIVLTINYPFTDSTEFKIKVR